MNAVRSPWAELHELRAEVERLRAEVAAYRAADADAERQAGEDFRRIRAAAFLRSGPQAAAFLLAMVDHPGRIISKGALLDATRGLPGVDPDADPAEKQVDVVISRIRARLEFQGWPRDTVRTAWGLGYYVEAGPAARLAAIVSELQEAD